MHTSFFSSILSPHLLHFSCTYSCVLPWYLTLFCTQLISINWYSKVCVLNICAPAKPSILDNALCLDMENHVCPLVNKGKPGTRREAAYRIGISWNAWRIPVPARRIRPASKTIYRCLTPWRRVSSYSTRKAILSTLGTL